MRNTVAKRLRREALQEMLLDNVPKRDLVWGRDSVINSPKSVRALYLKLKKFWVQPHRPALAPLPSRTPKRSGFVRPALTTGPALIASPLKLIKRLFPGFTAPDGSYQSDPTTALAIAWAEAGQGHKVSRLARRFA
jgi:hypothetical protein